MLIKKSHICIWVLFFFILFTSRAHADPGGGDGLGQTIQINTRLHSFVGRPSWLLIIRDLDHGDTIPYLYDFTRGDDFWIAFTFGRSYVITVSNLQFAPYRWNPYCQKKINNFCNLESNGRIIRGKSMIITISGDLSPNTDSYSCHVMTYPDSKFIIVNPGI